jgi:hypothetical protein
MAARQTLVMALTKPLRMVKVIGNTLGYYSMGCHREHFQVSEKRSGFIYAL